MKHLFILFCIIGLFVSEMLGQSVYPIPFASQDNKIELVVANSSTRTAEEVKIEVTHTPAWLKFQSKLVALSTLKSKEEYTALFNFSVEKTAEVNKEQTLSFTITTKNGESWTKEIIIRIAPPATYELFQNYPNPFNPTTVISYQLSAISKVNLKVFDILGREVARLMDEQQEPGYHQTSFRCQWFIDWNVYLPAHCY